MLHFFDIKFIENIDWVLGSQYFSSFAIIFAAIVAGTFQQRKEKILKKINMTYYLGTLQFFKSSVNAYFYESFEGNLLPKGFSSGDLWKQITDDYISIKNEKIDIIKAIPITSIPSFQSFLLGCDILMFIQHQDDEVLSAEWAYPEKSLTELIAQIKIGLKPYFIQKIEFLFYKLKIKKETS